MDKPSSSGAFHHAPREPVDGERLRTDLALCLEFAGTKTARANLAREDFRLVAETIVEDFVKRGYEVTAPRCERIGPGPQPVFTVPPDVRRED